MRHRYRVRLVESGRAHRTDGRRVRTPQSPRRRARRLHCRRGAGAGRDGGGRTRKNATVNEAEIVLLTAQYALYGAIATALITGVLGVVIGVGFKGFLDRRHADKQVDRDLLLHRATLAHQERTAAYGRLDEWITTVTNRADDICFDSELAGLPESKRNEYDICVAMHRDILRPPAAGRYLWSREVSLMVREVQNLAVEMAQKVILEGLGPDEEHGHDDLERLADLLRQDMSDHLDGKGTWLAVEDSAVQPRSRRQRKYRLRWLIARA